MFGCFPSKKVAPESPRSKTSVESRKSKRATIVTTTIREQALTCDDYEETTSLFKLMKPPNAGPDALAPVVLLSGKWLLKRAAELRAVSREERFEMKLPRRQDLERDHPEAFLGGDPSKCPQTLEDLPRGPPVINNPLPVISVSHCWHSKAHPDPYGDNLLALADAIEARIKVGKDEKEAVLSNDPARQEAAAKALKELGGSAPDTEFGVFMDWVSLHQRGEGGADRTEDEDHAFSTALARMQLWYAHQKTLVYLLTATPTEWIAERKAKGESDPIPHKGRGWPTLERLVCMLVKSHSSKSWATIVNVGDPKDRPKPPLTPKDFKRLLKKLTFTNGADKEVVNELYTKTIETALGDQKVLRYAGLGWGDEEIKQLCKVLPLCHSLESLNLKGTSNRYTSASAKMLANVLGKRKNLPNLMNLGVGCVANEKGLVRNLTSEKATGRPEPLLHNESLIAVCEMRGISLRRDVDEKHEAAGRRASLAPSANSRRSSMDESSVKLVNQESIKDMTPDQEVFGQ